MSFILDALKKADSERHLGELPGIHSRALPAAQARLPSPFLRRRSTWLLAALPALAAVAWFALPYLPPTSLTRMPVQLTRSAPSDAAPAPPALALVPAPSLAPAPVPVPAARTAEVANDIPVPPPLPAPAPAPPTIKTVPAAPAGARTAIASDKARSEASAAVLPVARPATRSLEKPVEPAATANLITDLPPNLQREIPKLAIAGSIYSSNPADRMLLIDKRMLHEGDEISPGLVLETVMPKAATLRYKGHAFRVVF